MRSIARISDSSDHGGHIVSASSNATANGLKIAIDGDIHRCPIQGHGDTILIGGGSLKSKGRHVIREGDRAGCGAIIITGSHNNTTNTL